MSILVQELSKKYGSQYAVNNISFAARKGEILGFLGPNGAGKTTTMKMITGYVTPSDGHLEVCGFDVSEEPLQASAKIGYLPENNPLYLDMYVKEYLHFAAGLHKIDRRKERVADMIEQTGLQREQHKQIRQLSKGYRQRVGLAQAMIHNPEVLILDEPTSGLDPNQLVEIRSLIKDLGKEKTVIFSTHIMQEVQALCDRVIIIDRGNIVADDHIDDLEKRISGQVEVSVTFDRTIPKSELLSISGVKQVKNIPAATYVISCEAGIDVRPAIFNFAVSKGLVLLEMHKETYSVEKVFQQLTAGVEVV